MLKNDLIIVTTDNYAKKIIEENKLNYNLKIYNIDEFKKKYYFSYESDVLLYMKNKYKMIPEISSIVLSNLLYIENKKYSTDKLNELVKIKKDLEENGYIIKNPNFKKFINNKEIICYNTKFKDFKIVEDKIEKKETIEVYKYDTIEDEVIATCMQIEELISKGIDINKIKLNTLDGSYVGVLNRIFNFYNIPYELNSTNKMYYLNDIKKFMKNTPNDTKILDLNVILENLDLEETIHNKLVSIINKYSNYNTFNDIKEILEYELKNTTIKIKKYDNVIREINYKNYIALDDEYVFMLGFNQSIIPKIHKDDLYLSDIELKEINEDTSLDRNETEAKILTNFINMTKNLVISYKLTSSKQEFGYSNYLTNFDNIVEKTINYDYKNEKLNKLLLANRLDNYILYNDQSKDLIDLLSNYRDLKYNTYNNNYEKIDFDIIKKQLNNKINLSYSNITTFYKCQFRFLLENIYKISTFEETVSQIIGKLFHRVLEETYKYNRKDYDILIDKALMEFYPNGMTKKEKFYGEKYRIAIKELIEILNTNMKKTSFENSYFEQSFSIKKQNDLDVTIKGFVDKIMTFKSDNCTYVIVIDYKTGGMHNDFKKVVHGLDMQLLMYLYLIKNTNLIENPKFAGMYLQQIMTEVLNKDSKKTYKEQVYDKTKLNGYTLKDLNVVSKIDSNFDTSSYVDKLKLKKDGEFANSSKVLSEDEINEYIEIVSNNIDNVINEICQSNFNINPKKIKNTIEGCEYCSFKDICYVTNDNIIELELGGDTYDTSSEE